MRFRSTSAEQDTGHEKHLQMISSFSKSDFQLIIFNEVLVLFLIRASITDYILFDKKSQWGPSDTPVRVARQSIVASIEKSRNLA